MILVIFLVYTVTSTILITFVLDTEPGSGRIIDTLGLFYYAECFLEDFSKSGIPLKNKTQNIFWEGRKEE
jgi:uncharacterized membrane protein